MISRTQLLRGIFWAAVQTWGTRITSLAVFLILVRLLPPQDIGALALIGTVLMFMQAIAEGGMAEYLVQKISADECERNGIFWVQLAISIILALSLAGAGMVWGRDWIDHPDAGHILTIMAITLPLTAAARVPEALIRASLHFRPLALRSLISSLIGGVVGITLALNGQGIWSLVFKQVAESLVDLGLIYAYSNWRPGKPSFSGISKAFNYGISLLGSRIIDVFNQRSDILIVGFFLGTASVGLYTVAQRLIQTLIELFSGVAGKIAVPFLASVKTDQVQLKALQLKFVRVANLVNAPVYILLAVVAPVLLPWLFGTRWESSVEILQWLCAIGPLIAISYFGYAVLLATGRPTQYFLLTLCSASCNVVAISLGAWSFGLIGAAIGFVARYILMLPLIAGTAGKITATNFMDWVRAVGPGFVTGALVGLSSYTSLVLTESLHVLVRLACTGISATVTLALAWWWLFPGVWGLLRDISDRSKKP